MSIRNGMLALLSEQAMYGAQLQAEFEARTGGTWPLNVGQVYQTLRRLERDGLVAAADDDAAGEEGRVRYGLTDAGWAALGTWWASPADRASRPRDEVTIKLALAATIPGVDVPGIVQVQRHQCLSALQELTRLKQRATDNDDVAWLLVLDNLVFLTEAEVRWLDHVQTRLARRNATPSASGAPAPRAEQEVRR